MIGGVTLTSQGNGVYSMKKMIQKWRMLPRSEQYAWMATALAWALSILYAPWSAWATGFLAGLLLGAAGATFIIAVGLWLVVLYQNWREE